MNIVRCCVAGVSASFLMVFSVLGAAPTFQAMPGAAVPAQVPQQQPLPQPQGIAPQFVLPEGQPGQPIQPQPGLQPNVQLAPGVPQPGAPMQPGVPSVVSPTEQLNANQPSANSGSGAALDLSVFGKKGDGLEKMEIKRLLKRAIVICVGDWCPHCANFLGAFSKYTEALRLYGINIVFVHIPTLEVLSNWHDPTLADYQSADAKLQQFGIKADSPEVKSNPAGIFLVMLGSKDTLTKINVSSLPTTIGSQDQKECFRYVGEEALRALDLSNPDTLTNLLKTFNQSTAEKDDKDADDTSKKGADKKGRSKKGKSKGSAAKKSGSSKEANAKSGPIDKIGASRATQLLNEGKSPDTSAERNKPHSSHGCSCFLLH